MSVNVGELAIREMKRAPRTLCVCGEKLAQRPWGVCPASGSGGWLCDACVRREAPELLPAVQLLAGEIAMFERVEAVEESPYVVEESVVWPADHLASK